MGFLKTLPLLIFTLVLFVSSTYELRTYETLVLLQLRKHLEYPLPLEVWQNYSTGDFCNLSSSPQLSIVCQGNSVTELKIMGDKLAKVSDFHGSSVPNKTLSGNFSIDSFVTTLTRLKNLRVLSLVSLGIWGPLPDKIHRLYSLEFLDLSSNFMFGSIPFQMSRLVKIHTLILDDNFFNETLPYWFDSLQNLTVLSLKNNRLSGSLPSSLSKITTLSDISFPHNSFSGKLPDISSLTSLRLLDLRENHFDSELPKFPKGLTTILLSNNSLSGEIPDQIGNLNQLQHLDLSSNFLSGAPPAILFLLPNISYLNLASNRMSGSLPENLNCGDALGFVDISNNRFFGWLPSCLNSTSDKRIVKFGGNCLSVDVKHQHPNSYCEEFRPEKTHSKGIAIALLLIGVIGGILLLLLSGIGVFFFFCRRNHSRGKSNLQAPRKVLLDDPPSGISSEVLANARIISQATKLGTPGSPAYRVFAVQELEEATNNFDQSAYLGEGSIGKIYKGRLENGNYVAIRLMAMHRKYLKRNLKLRLDMLSKLRHPNLVTLLGHCIDDGGGLQDESTINRVFLVYEFIPNGNFHAHLSETSPEKVLKWSDRLAVLIGVAKAVHFLHTGIIPPSSCNRLKTNNVLLDEHGIAKLSDYGMSILREEEDKNEGKRDISKSWHMNKLEDDVYNFGFILLESLVGPIVRGKEEAFLLNEMASSFGSQDGRRRIADPVVLTTSTQESLSIVISITNKCISHESNTRPSLEDVLWNLQYAAQVQATADADQKSDALSQS